MITFTKKDLSDYMTHDIIMEWLEAEEDQNDSNVRTHQWLKTMDNKRLVYQRVYGDLLAVNKEEKKSILDIGGGYTSLTKRMLRNHTYELLDFIAHGGEEAITQLQNDCGYSFWNNEDWMEFDCNGKTYDIIIANDIFPDVDQRMELFIDKYLPCCRELRLVLTFYNLPKYYRTQRVDDAEILTFLSWDGEITGIKLKKYLDRIIDTDEKQLDMLSKMTDSIYWNGRQVVYLVLKGEIK